MQQQNYSRNRIGWIILALVCLGVGVMVGGRGAAFMGMAQQRASMNQQSGPMMGRGQMMQPEAAQGQQDQQGQQAQGRPRFHHNQSDIQQGGHMGRGGMHDHGRGGFGILGLLGKLAKLALLAMGVLFLLNLWRDRNDPNNTRRWPWERRQTPEPGTTDPPYTGNTSSL